VPDETNPAERRRWNDERWIAVWPKRERFTDAVTPRLLDALALAPGERVLDTGCGGGNATIEAGRRVGPGGSVTGADLSAALVDLARRRTLAAGVENVTYQVVDMQHDHVTGAPFDVVMSQFGVMFFDEPVTAFTNIASHLREGGRLAFACWQPAERNPWFFALALAPFLAPPPPPAAGKSPTGPFALGDHERTAEILRAAGFSGIERTPIDLTVDVPEDALVDDEQLALMGVAESEMPAARRAIDEHMSKFRLTPGLSRFPLAFQIFAATRAQTA
jgi:SAM-dependent methyltransferase